MLPLVCCCCPWSHGPRLELLYTIEDVTLMCAVAGLLLMSLEPWAVTRKAINYFRSDTHFVLPLVGAWCPWSQGLLREKLYRTVNVRLMCAAAGLLLMSLEPWAATRKAINYCGCVTHVCCRRCAADVHGDMSCYEKS